MGSVRIVSDPEECAALWKSIYPAESLFDLWIVRNLFAQFYSRENCFIVHEDNGKADGLIPLCRITDERSGCNHHSDSFSASGITQSYAFFPGEVWKNRTWMEQNRIISASSGVTAGMIEAIPADSDIEIRYLCNHALGGLSPDPGTMESNPIADRSVECGVDETGYLFYPEHYGYDYTLYLSAYSGKSRKKILSEVAALEKMGLSFRYDCMDDIDAMFRMNIENFGEHGYFHDVRFLNSFEHLARLLHDRKMLRVVTVLIGGRIAAVDMGSVLNKSCIMLAGGTSQEFKGVAKLINLHHMEWACSEKIRCIDFLCGDFGWKERFHLTPRNLYKITIHS